MRADPVGGGALRTTGVRVFRTGGGTAGDRIGAAASKNEKARNHRFMPAF